MKGFQLCRLLLLLGSFCLVQPTWGCHDTLETEQAMAAKRAGICGDPHLTGIHGETFDWHGIPGKSFCLLTDPEIHINAHVTGQEGEAGTWFDAMGFLFTVGGRQHTLLFELDQEVPADDENNLGISLDNQAVPADEFRHALPNTRYGDLIQAIFPKKRLTLTRWAENGALVNINIDGILNATLQTDTHEHPDGKHFDLHVHKMHVTSQVHGVLGQTFQPSRAKMIQAAMNLRGPAMDAEDLVEGTDLDYETASLLDADCKYGLFGSSPVETPEGGVSIQRRLLVRMGLMDQEPYPVTVDQISCRRTSARTPTMSCHFASL